VAKHVLGFSSQEGVIVLQKYVFFSPLPLQLQRL